MSKKMSGSLGSGRGRILAPLLVILSLTINACAGDDSTAGGGGGLTVDRDATLRIGIDFVPTTFDPIKVVGNSGPPVLVQVYDQLIQFDEDLQPAPMLATSWEFADDGTEMRMTLRDDVVFNGSGDHLDAEAVKANLERAKTSPESLVATSLADLESVSVVDEFTLSLKFRSAAYTFPALLAYEPRVSSIVDPAHLNDANLATQPQGSGPYTLTSANQSKIVLTRTDKHWDKTSGLAKTIELTAIADPNARFAGLQAGQLDLTFINTGQYDAAEQLEKSGKFQTFYGHLVQKYIIRINPNRVPDPNVRKAISLALDRTAFCDSQYAKMGRASQQLFVETNDGYDAAFDTDVEPKLEEAKQLLLQAGVSEMKLSLLGLAISQGRMEIIQDQLKPLGIDVEISTAGTFSESISEYLAGKYDAQMAGLQGSVDPSAIIDQDMAAPAGFGVPDYLSDAVDTARHAAPGEARDSAWHAVNEALLDKPYDIPLCDNTLGLVGSDKVVGMSDVRFISYGPPFESRRLGLAG